VRSRHFITMAEEEAHAKAILSTDEDGWVRRLSLAGIVAALFALAGVAWFASRPATEDVLRKRIEAAAAEGDVQELVKVEDSIAEYLVRFGENESAEKMKKYQEEIELYRLERQFDLKARRLGGTQALLPVERAYLEAMQLAPLEPETALAKLEAIPVVFGGTEHNTDDPLEARSITRCVELARKQAEQLRDSVGKTLAEERQFLRRRIESANQLAAKDPAAARAILQGIVELYADRPWASALVTQAQESLAQLPQP
jgi:eukaryotic-like serine/threonine-protein kinase